jgi:hypothetical protein
MDPIDFQARCRVVFEGCDRIGMSAQQIFNRRCRLVATSQPNDLGWGTEQGSHVGEIGVKRDKHEAVQSCVLPERAITGVCQTKLLNLG